MTALLASELPDIHGQYAWDHAIGDPNDSQLTSDPSGTKDARGDGSSFMHDSELSLYDEASDKVPDPATGRAPSTKNSDPHFDLVRVGGLSIVDVVSAVQDKRRARRPDKAAEWLMKNDPRYQKDKKSWGE